MNSPSRIVHEVRVLYGDTDQMAVVYYANYLRFFEAGRNEFCRAREIPYREVEAQGLMLPVVEVQVHYRQPARYDDRLSIETWVPKVGRVQLRFAYEIWREPDRTLLTCGHTVHACLDSEGKLRRLPERLREGLQAVAGEPGNEVQ